VVWFVCEKVLVLRKVRRLLWVVVLAEASYGGSTVQQQVIPTLRDWSKVLQLSETKEYLNDIERSLRRQEYNDELRKYVTRHGIVPLMNEEGIQKTMSYLRSIIHRTIGQGNFDDKKEPYRSIIADIWEVLNDDLFVNEGLYQLNQNDYNFVMGIFIVPTKIYLTRLLGDRERKYIYGDEKSTSWASYFKPRQKGDGKNSVVYE